ncbi:MAG: AarF/ABC1/UbiB kinase family protein [Candidatus Sericytochromatia bacterium]|nr:AarF/ABC1/UbiB kinase family protein [Candidatus Sericytochromatia bacterium]
MTAPAPLPPTVGLTYDPLVLPGVLQAAGGQAWRRRWRLARVLLSFTAGFWLDGRQPPARREARQRARAAWLKGHLVELGATFVKIGQVLSTRPDLVPLPYVEEMASLQDQVPPFDSTEARAIIEAELGQPIDALFSVFNPYPIAAASIGQVYKARLRDLGLDVVVKVQRPGLLPVMQLDLAILRQLTAFVDRHPKLGRGMPYTAILDEFGHSLFVQADYRTEAAFAERFRGNFSRFPGVATPRIHHGLTTSRVMVMDFVDGVKPTDLVGLADAGVSFQDIVRIGVRATIKQLLEDGFFHADVHPGNLFVDRQGQLVYIDFGMVGELSPFVQEKIVDVFLHSVHRQYAALVDDFIALEFLSPHVDREALVPVAEHIFTSQYGERGERLTVKEVFASVSRVLYEYPFRIPEKIAFILRTIITLEGIIHQIWPDFRFLEVATPYAAKILLTDAKANIREKLVDELFVAGKFRPDRLGKLFGAASREPTFKFGEVTPAVIRYLTAPEGRRVREGLLSVLTDQVAVPDEAAGAGWGAYVALAAQDPAWSLDELLVPLLEFLETPEGRDYVRRALAVPGLWRLADGQGGAGPRDGGLAWDGLLTGRPLSSETRQRLMAQLEALLSDPQLALQPVVERLALLLDSPAGRRWFEALGQRLLLAPESFEGRFLEVVAQAAANPHLDISPLVRTFFRLATSPEGKPWQTLLLHWFRRPTDGEAEERSQLEPLWRALQPLLADGRLRVSEVAFPTLGWLFSEDGEAVRGEVLSSLRERLPSVDWGGVAQGLWRAAGQTFRRWRDALGRDDPGGPDRERGGTDDA